MQATNVAELVDQVRSQIDEFNSVGITDQHILDALNRAQKAATRFIARRLDTIFLAEEQINTIAGQREYDMPRDVFGRRIEKVELRQGSIVWRIQHISYKQRHPFIVTSQVTRPYYYDIVGTKIRLYPRPAGDLILDIHYSRQPDALVLPQGQINSIDTVNNYVIVDDIGTDVTTDSTSRNSFLNIVDFVTGDVKASLQVAFTDDSINQIKFKSTGLTRTSVFDKTISTSIPATVNPDDYVCLVKGVAVPQLPDAYHDYLIQHAIVALKRRTREPTEEEYAALKDIERELMKLMQGREQAMRIRKASSHFGKPLGGTLRRYFS